VNDSQRRKQLLRRIEADSLLPPLHEKDNPSINFRRILIEREELGFRRPRPRSIQAIREKGYDIFFIDQMNIYTKIGLVLFHKLAAIDRLELTTEYNIFHHYRDALKSDCRRRIAILLASKFKELE
jgi:hypothetical protein